MLAGLAQQVFVVIYARHYVNRRRPDHPFWKGAERKFVYEYNLKDHLGNSRVTFMGTSLSGAVDVVQTTNYYPFGLIMNTYNGNTASSYRKNKYLYNGKELQDEILEEVL